MGERVITDYPRMGTSAATQWDNVSASNTDGTLVGRREYSSMVEAATAKPRRQIHERLGHVGGIQVKRIVYQNVPEASSTQSRVYTLPRKSSPQDFWDRRRYGGQTM